jgi:hypothetical protein
MIAFSPTTLNYVQRLSFTYLIVADLGNVLGGLFTQVVIRLGVPVHSARKLSVSVFALTMAAAPLSGPFVISGPRSALVVSGRRRPVVDGLDQVASSPVRVEDVLVHLRPGREGLLALVHHGRTIADGHGVHACRRLENAGTARTHRHWRTTVDGGGGRPLAAVVDVDPRVLRPWRDARDDRPDGGHEHPAREE